MLHDPTSLLPSHEAATSFDVDIAAIATSVPGYSYSQADALRRAKVLMPECARLEPVFRRTGVERRYSCVPMDWYLDSPGWRDSNQIYLDNALDLLETAAHEALTSANAEPRDVDAIVCVSSTGIAIPGLDARLSNRMKLNQYAERLPVFGLGCAGGTSGLSRAARMTQTMENGVVLLLVVELAGINVHFGSKSPALFVSSALFGDGAAAIVLRNTRSNHARASSFPVQTAERNSHPVRVVAFGEYLWRDSEHIMGWKIEDDGLDVILDSTLPRFIEKSLKAAVAAFLYRHRVTQSDIDGYVFHPGGRKILDAIETALDIGPGELRHSRDVLRDYGNMSAPTVFFILQRTIQSGASGKHLMVSFGPAFTVTFALLDL